MKLEPITKLECPHCGAGVQPDLTTAKQVCEYCHQPLLLKGDFLEKAEKPRLRVLNTETTQEIISLAEHAPKNFPAEYVKAERNDFLAEHVLQPLLFGIVLAAIATLFVMLWSL